MGSCCGDAQAALARQADDLAAKADHFAPGMSDVAADRGADFDHRFMHLALDLVLQPLLSFGEHLLDVRFQLARLRVDDLKFLFDAEREGGLGHCADYVMWRTGNRACPDRQDCLSSTTRAAAPPPSSPASPSASCRSAPGRAARWRSRSAPRPCC